MVRRTALKGFCTALVFGLFFSPMTQAAELKCDVCGMPIRENGRNLIVLRNNSQNTKSMHSCSPICAHKLQKYSPEYNKVEVRNFNHTGEVLSGDKAYFLIQSAKIKSDMGENVMAPYAAAFNTKEEAEAAQKKYGDGVIVKGAINAFK